MSPHVSNMVVAVGLLVSPLLWLQDRAQVLLGAFAGSAALVCSWRALRGCGWAPFMTGLVGLWLLAGAFLVAGERAFTVIHQAASGVAITSFAAVSALSTDLRSP